MTLTGGSGATSWTLQRSPTGAGTWTNIATPTVGAATVDATVVTGTVYDFRLVATSGAGSANSNVVTGIAVALGDWKLPTGNFVSAKMPMEVVYPRPDAETSATVSRHRNAHPDLVYEIPIGIQGGAYPFKYEFVTSPSGATMGQKFGDANYGIVQWTPTTPGTYSFSVKVTDQDLNEVTVNWSVVVGTSNFYFVDAASGVNAAGRGLVSTPVAALAYAVANAGSKIIVFRAGQYYVPANDIGLTISLLAHPGESVSIDCSATNTTGFGGTFKWNSSDIGAYNIRFHNLTTLQGNPRYFATTAASSRLVQYKCIFDGGSIGTAGNDNVSCNFLGNPGVQRSHCMQSHCTFRGPFPASPNGNGFSAYDIYRTSFFLHQENIYEGTGGGGGPTLWTKGGNNENITVRRNRFNQPWSGGLLNFALSMDSGDTFHRNLESCYNTIISTNTNNPSVSNSVVSVGSGSHSFAGVLGPVWSYRNTYVGLAFVWYRDSMPLELRTENDIIICDLSVAGMPHKWFMRNSNDGASTLRNPATRPNTVFSATGIECHQSTSAGVLDSNYLLTGAYRTTHIGKRGAEISA